MVTHPRQHQQKVQCQATDSDSMPRACPISTAPKFQCTQISRKSYPNSTQGTAWDSAQVPQAVRSQPAKQLHRLPLHFFGLPFAGRLGFSGSASEGAAASSSYRGAMLDGSLGWWQCSTQHRGIGKHSHNSKLSGCYVQMTWNWEAGGEAAKILKCAIACFAASANCTTIVASYTLHRTLTRVFPAHAHTTYFADTIQSCETGDCEHFGHGCRSKQNTNQSVRTCEMFCWAAEELGCCAQQPPRQHYFLLPITCSHQPFWTSGCSQSSGCTCYCAAIHAAVLVMIQLMLLIVPVYCCVQSCLSTFLSMMLWLLVSPRGICFKALASDIFQGLVLMP